MSRRSVFFSNKFFIKICETSLYENFQKYYNSFWSSKTLIHFEKIIFYPLNLPHIFFQTTAKPSKPFELITKAYRKALKLRGHVRYRRWADYNPLRNKFCYRIDSWVLQSMLSIYLKYFEVVGSRGAINHFHLRTDSFDMVRPYRMGLLLDEWLLKVVLGLEINSDLLFQGLLVGYWKC